MAVAEEAGRRDGRASPGIGSSTFLRHCDVGVVIISSYSASASFPCLFLGDGRTAGVASVFFSHPGHLGGSFRRSLRGRIFYVLSSSSGWDPVLVALRFISLAPLFRGCREGRVLRG